jgi:hypothetical protein
MSKLHLAKFNRLPKHLSTVPSSDIRKVRDTFTLGGSSVDDEIEPAPGVQLRAGSFRFRPDAPDIDVNLFRHLMLREPRANRLSRGRLWASPFDEMPGVLSVRSKVVQLLIAHGAQTQVVPHRLPSNWAVGLNVRSWSTVAGRDAVAKASETAIAPALYQSLLVLSSSTKGLKPGSQAE